MRWMTRAVAGAASVGLAVVLATPASAATPGPREEEWWFGSWAVQNKVWPITEGKGVTVAVIDSGSNGSLPDFSGGVMLPGKSFLGAADGRTDTDTANSHGTWMAALIAAQGTGTGMVGVAPGVKLLPVIANDSDTVAEGIKYAVNNGATVINISQAGGGYCRTLLQEAVSYALEHDVIIVAGAGNEGDTTNFADAPANCAGVLAVGAIDSKLKAWEKTQRQPYVAVAGPGVDVCGIDSKGRFFARGAGTSTATALVSGAIALVRSKFPDMPARDVVQRIIYTARDSGPPGIDDQTGYGIVRPYNALTVTSVPKDAPNPVFAAYDKWKTPPSDTLQQAPAPTHTKDAAELARDKRSRDAKRNTKLLLIGGPIVLLLLLMLLVGGLILVTRRNKPAIPAGPGFGGPPYAGPSRPSVRLAPAPQQPPGPYIQDPGDNDRSG
jgi:type VII secretion-associated serine protease mycosin